jgi:hypothetical protein
VAEPSTALHDSFGLDDHLAGPPASERSATNEAIKDRQALRRLVHAGVLAADQMPPAPRILTPILTPADAPAELQAAAQAALSMPSPADD